MANKSHLKFLSEKQISEVKNFKYNYGFDGKEVDENQEPKNYEPLAKALRRDFIQFNREVINKYRLKDQTLNIPIDIDYVNISFQDQFVINNYFQDYYNDFGLEAIAFYDFAKKGLFAVVNRDKFETFITNILNFTENILENNRELEYSNYIKYISGFELLTARDILKVDLEHIGDVVYLSLVNLQLEDALKQQLLTSLIEYLDHWDIVFIYDEDVDRIELRNPTPAQIQKIVQNFDIIQSITSSVFTTISPSEFNTVRRGFGFDIVNAEEDLPIVGIIDTGIAQQTVLGALILNDTSFTLAGSPLVDEAGRNRLGHGTAVAGLVALGRQNHRNDFENEVLADARLLSIKISDNGSGYISEIDLINMLYAVKEKYPEIRLFTLTTCYRNAKIKNETFSEYTYALDKFAFETDSLIFISTGNNDDCINENTSYDLSYFHGDQTNLSTPADSMNNVTVGAAADNLRAGVFYGIATSREFPALYSRKGHIDLSVIYSSLKTNKNYFKPDVIDSGGDIGYYSPTTLDWTDEPALTLLSARAEFGVMKEVGTSFSAPLTANLAARIIKNYPSLSNESIKALIINGASTALISFEQDVSKLKNNVMGNGLVNDMKSLYSDENSATLILEDHIKSGDMRVYPIHFPKYLIEDDLGKTQGILKVTATLCFKFLPIKNNQLSYNPIHMAFTVFKNHSADDIMKPDNTLKSKLRSTLSWSENGRYVSKPLPYSNTQKITFNVNVNDLISESNTFKLAIHAKTSEQLIGGLPDNYPTEFPFSIVLTIEETIKNNSGKLYDEIQLVNHLEAVQDLNLETGIEVDDLDV